MKTRRLITFGDSWTAGHGVETEKEYKENNLDNLNLTKDEILDLILIHPKLLQRPVFVFNNKAIIGRPPEDVLKII